MNKSMKFLSLLQLGVLGASGAFIYNNDFQSTLSKQIKSYLSSSPIIGVARDIVSFDSTPSLLEATTSSDVKIHSASQVNTEIQYKDSEQVSSKAETKSPVINYSLLIEKISFKSISFKSWDVESVELISSDALLTESPVEESEYLTLEDVQPSELSTNEVSSHFGFNREEKIIVQSWAAAFKGIEIKEVIASNDVGAYEETVSEDLITHNRAIKEKLANELIDEVASAASSVSTDSALEIDQNSNDYSPTKLEFTKINDKAVNNQDDLKPSKQGLQKIEKINLNRMLEESNTEFEKLDLESANEVELENEYSVAKGEISSNVNMAIQREMEMRAGTKNVSNYIKKQPVLAQALTTQSGDYLAASEESKVDAKTKRSNPSVGDIKSRITAFGVDLEDGKYSEIKGFDLSYSYEYNSNLSDENTGAIDFNFKANSSDNVLRVNLRGDNGYIASNSDLALEDGIQFAIPLLSREGLYKFFEKKSLNGIGSIVLVEFNEATNSVDISSPFEGKIFFDENFKEVEMQEAAQYVMFVGVKPGNSLLSFQTIDNEIVDKIINTTEDELYFESNDYYASKRESVHLFEKKLMSNERVPLELFREKINYFNTNIQFEKKAQNTYSYLRPRMSFGMRKYFEVNRDQGLLIVGYGDNNKIELPSETLISEYQNLIGNDSEQSCYIQTNIQEKKELKSVQYNGHTTHGDASNMNVSMLAIDSDGQHGDEIVDKSKIIILSSSQQGTISLRVDYQDNTSQIFNTFCSPGTYLIEQL